MKKLSALTVFALLLTALFVGSAPRVLAQTSSPSAEVREVFRKVQMEKLNIGTGEVLIGVVGSVTRVSPATFVLTDPSGRERTIVIDPDKTSFAATSTVRSLSDLAIDSGVAVIGSSSDSVLIHARRVIPAARPFVETRRVALGSVQTVGRTSLTLQERGNDQTTTVDITTATIFEDILGNPVPRTSVQEDEAVLLVINETTPGKPFAKRVRLLVSATEE